MQKAFLFLSLIFLLSCAKTELAETQEVANQEIFRLNIRHVLVDPDRNEAYFLGSPNKLVHYSSASAKLTEYENIFHYTPYQVDASSSPFRLHHSEGNSLVTYDLSRGELMSTRQIDSPIRGLAPSSFILEQDVESAGNFKPNVLYVLGRQFERITIPHIYSQGVFYQSIYTPDGFFYFNRDSLKFVTISPNLEVSVELLGTGFSDVLKQYGNQIMPHPSNQELLLGDGLSPLDKTGQIGDPIISEGEISGLHFFDQGSKFVVCLPDKNQIKFFRYPSGDEIAEQTFAKSPEYCAVLDDEIVVAFANGGSYNHILVYNKPF